MAKISKINEIDWSLYECTENIPKYLEDLFSNNKEKVTKAVSELENELCHQHVYVIPALLPAFPFLIEGLRTITDTGSLGLLMEFFWGISRVTNQPDRFYPIRILDLSWTSIPDKPPVFREKHIREIRKQLLSNREVFTPFLRHNDDYILKNTAFITGNFIEIPDESAQKLRDAILNETSPSRKNILFWSFIELHFIDKADYLIKMFYKETDKVVKATIASQVLYEMKSDSPADIVEFLSDVVLKTPMPEIVDIYGMNFFEDAGIPLAVAQPDKYREIMQRFINCLNSQKFIVSSTCFLAFALCWNGKLDFENLTNLQLNAIETIYQKSWQGKNIYPSTDGFEYFSLPTRQEDMKAFLADHKY